VGAGEQVGGGKPGDPRADHGYRRPRRSAGAQGAAPAGAPWVSRRARSGEAHCLDSVQSWSGLKRRRHLPSLSNVCLGIV
jgi:hypothetical protein